MDTTQNGSLEQILLGPEHENDDTFNLMGSLRASMATCGHEDIPSFHRAEVMVAPALQTEGKALQRDQSIGMGATRAAAPAPAPPSGDGLIGPGGSPAGQPLDPALEEAGASQAPDFEPAEPPGAPVGSFIDG